MVAIKASEEGLLYQVNWSDGSAPVWVDEGAVPHKLILEFRAEREKQQRNKVAKKLEAQRKKKKEVKKTSPKPAKSPAKSPVKSPSKSPAKNQKSKRAALPRRSGQRRSQSRSQSPVVERKAKLSDKSDASPARRSQRSRTPTRRFVEGSDSD